MNIDKKDCDNVPICLKTFCIPYQVWSTIFLYIVDYIKSLVWLEKVIFNIFFKAQR